MHKVIVKCVYHFVNKMHIKTDDAAVCNRDNNANICDTGAQNPSLVVFDFFC